MLSDSIPCPNCQAEIDLRDFKNTKTTLTVYCLCTAYFHVWKDEDAWQIGKVHLVNRDEFIREEMKTMKEIEEGCPP